MRNIIITILTVALVSTGMYFWTGTISFSVLIGVIIGIVVFFILTKSIMKEVEVLNAKAQKAISQQKYDRAINIYKSGIKLKWKSPFIAGQMYGLIGMLYYIKKEHANAIPNLQKSSFSNWVAKGMLGIIYMQQKDFTNMEKVFKSMISYSKKEGLAWGLYAYCLYKLQRKDDAIKILEEGNKKLKENDDRIKTNLLEIKNGRRMKMKVFGDQWYQFMLENPPRKKITQQAPGYMKYKKNAVYR